jgi:DNA-directed RNA polymerase alpha subunit
MSEKQIVVGEDARLKRFVKLRGDKFFMLSIRAARALESAEISTVKQLKLKNDEQLLKIKGLGRATLNELKDLIAAY